MNSVELFAGAGGLALAVSEAGFEHLAIVERDQYACETILENRRRGIAHVKGWPQVVPSDVREFDYSSLAGEVHLVTGGPPCQPFSLAGKHRAYNDSRDMFPQAVRAVRELQPLAFVFENVRGLVRSSFASYFEYITLQLQYPEITRKRVEEWPDHLSRLERHHTSGRRRGLRYNVVFQVLNAADYGVPQKRERVFIVGFRSDLDVRFSFPRASHSFDSLLWSQFVSDEYWVRNGVKVAARSEPPARMAKRVERLRKMHTPPPQAAWRTVRDAIGDLPDPLSHEAKKVANHRFNPGAKVYPGHTGSPLDEPAKTLKAGDHGVPGGENMLAAPSGDVRYFTVRESARLQTFPDDFHFPGSWTETMRQLGNAVPTQLGHVVLSRVAEKLEPIVRGG